MVKLDEPQIDAVYNMKDGCILCGGVGTGKSRTSLAYFYKEYGGDLFHKNYTPMENPPDLYIITTAKKRDTHEWEEELLPFNLGIKDETNLYSNKVVIDSWNNIKKYVEVEGAFFIFDEQRVVGYGAWTKAFLKICKHNRWILLSATPGDKWEDYIPVFIANGFYRNKTEFICRHIIYKARVKFPQVDRYIETKRLVRLRDQILVNIDSVLHTVPHHNDIYVGYNRELYRHTIRTRLSPYTGEPIESASEYCYTLRQIVNSDDDRQAAILNILDQAERAIVFYNFDYELDILRNLWYGMGTEIAEWNGHKHQPVPETKRWVYLVQYAAGCEGWNCVKTDTIIFYSQCYSYRMTVQASGRINRRNTPYIDLYYYHLKSRASIDIAISKALEQKKEFNAQSFTRGMIFSKEAKNERQEQQVLAQA